MFVLSVSGSLLFDRSSDFGGNVYLIFYVSLLIAISVILLLRRIRRSDVNSDAARGLIVESPTFLGYEGIDASEENDDDDNADPLQEYFDSNVAESDYIPPPIDMLQAQASDVDNGDIKKIGETSADYERSDSCQTTSSTRRIRSFIDRTNEMKKVPSSLIGKYHHSLYLIIFYSQLTLMLS